MNESQLYADLARLVTENGLGTVKRALAKVEVDCEEASPPARTRLPAPQLPRPSERARFVGRETRVPYTCEVIVEGADALKCWIQIDGTRGQGCWLPRNCIVSRVDADGPREVITTSRAFEWWDARRTGSNSIERIGAPARRAS